MRQRLSEIVSGAAIKRLSAVEAQPDRSHQHELNGVQTLRAVFGDERVRSPARFVYLGNDADDVTSSDGFVTWYDARADHPTRTEYRLYFPTTAASERIKEGDVAIVLSLADSSVVIAFAGDGSTAETQLLWLFGLHKPERGIEVADNRVLGSDVGFAAREILAQLGVEPAIGPAEEESYLDVMLDRFGGRFPSTAEFSGFARDVTTDADPVADPDEALIAWLEREEALFRQLERYFIQERLRQGFDDDVDAFVTFSLSIQNRRKSRVGFALENHVEAIFLANKVRFTRGQITERTSRPDFVFPSIHQYRDEACEAETLHMLGVKSTCKDRWRQILVEADRIPRKHLLTLEPGISRAQTDEMKARQVVLVIPRGLHSTYNLEQQASLMTVGDLVKLLASPPEDSR